MCVYRLIVLIHDFKSTRFQEAQHITVDGEIVPRFDHNSSMRNSVIRSCNNDANQRRRRRGKEGWVTYLYMAFESTK